MVTSQPPTKAYLKVLALALTLACAPSKHSIPPPSITEVAPSVFPAPGAAAEVGAPVALEVVQVTPEGASEQVRAISVTFNQPVVPLDTLDALDQIDPPLGFEPEVEGRFEWIGARTLRFVPARALPSATPFTAWVPEGTRGIHGVPLEEEFVWTFSTHRPKVVGIEPALGTRWARIDVPILATFNQPVDLAVLSERMAVTADRKPIRFRLRYRASEKGAASEVVEVLPRRALPVGARVELTIQSGLKGIEGLLPSTDTFRSAFETYGPLKVAGSECAGGRQCDVVGEFVFNFTNPLPPKAAQHVEIEPVPRAREGELVSVSGSSLRVSGTLTPGQSYKVTVSEAMVDVFGQTLGRAWTRVFRAGDVAPAMALDARDAVLEPGADEIIAQLVNVPSVKLTTAPVPEASLADVWRYARGLESALPRAVRSKQRTKSVKTSAKTNVPVDKAMPLSMAGDEGVVLVRLSAAVRKPRWAPYDLEAMSIAQATDLGLQVWYDYDQMLVWLTRLSDATPLVGERVALRSAEGALLWEGKSAEGGFVTLPGLNGLNAPPPYFVIAGQGADYAFRRVNGRSQVHGRWLEGYRKTRSARTPRRLVGHLFTDLGLYRPGDLVHLKGTLRGEDRHGVHALPEAVGQVKVKTVDPSGELLDERRVALTSQGTFHVPISLHSGVLAGDYQVVVEVEGLRAISPRSLEASFRVEAAHQPPIEAVLALQRHHNLPGDDIEAVVSAAYPFGTPLAGARAEWFMRATPAFFEPEGYQAFDFSPPLRAVKPAGTALLKGAARLSPDGAARLSIPTPSASSDRPRLVLLDVEVQNDSGEIATASATAMLHPASAYFGLSTARALQPIGARFDVEVVAVKPHGLPAIGLQGQVALERERRSKDEVVWEKVDACVITTQKTPLSCAFEAKQPGRHRIIATGTDAEGRPMRSARSVQVLGEPKSARAQPRASLEVDRDNAQVGESLRLVLRSPWKRSRAVLTVARMGLIEHRDLGVVGPRQVIDWPIESHHAPGVRFGVALVKGRDAEGAPDVAFCAASLRVGLAHKRLDVQVVPEVQAVTPGQRVSVTVRTSGQDGAPVASEVAVMVMSEAAWAHRGAQAPLPMEVFWRLGSPELAALDVRRALINGKARVAFEGVRLRGALASPTRTVKDEKKGGGSGLMVEGVWGGRVEKASPLIHYEAHSLTNDKGLAQVAVTLPGVPSDYRVVAVAVAGDRFASGVGLLRMSRPVSTRALMRGFARVGDRFEARALVENHSAEVRKIGVSLGLFGGGALRMLETPIRRVVLPAHGRSVVSFEVEALRPGRGAITLSVTEKKAMIDTVKHDFEVFGPEGMRRVSAFGMVRGALSQAVAPPPAVHPRVGGVSVGVSPSRAIELTGVVESLMEARHGDLFHSASRLIGASAVRGLVARGLVPDVDKAAFEAFARAQVAGVLASRSAEGGFGLWPGAPQRAWPTFMALLAMHRARAAGFEVPEVVYERALDVSEGLFQTRNAEALSPDERALGAAVLARIEPGRVRLALDLEPLSGEVQALSSASRAFLALAFEARLRQAGDTSAAMSILDALAEEAVRNGDGAVLMDGGRPDVLATSVALWALRQLRPGHPLVSLMADGLRGLLRGGSGSIEAQGIGLLSLAPLIEREAAELDAEATARVWHAGQLTFEAGFESGGALAAHTRIPMEALQEAGTSEVILARVGVGPPLHHCLVLQSAPAGLVFGPKDHGFAVDRVLVGLDGVPVPDAGLESAAVFALRVSFSSPQPRARVVLDVPLPAGAVLMEVGVEVTAGGLPEAPVAHTEAHAEGVALYFDRLPAGVYEHTLVLRATAPGRYHLPPARMHDADSPQVHGRSASGVLVVR